MSTTMKSLRSKKVQAELAASAATVAEAQAQKALISADPILASRAAANAKLFARLAAAHARHAK